MSTREGVRHPFDPDIYGKCGENLYSSSDNGPVVQRYCGEAFGAEIHTGTRPEPPELEFVCPDCSMCGKETYHDGDGFVCDPCGAYWGGNGRGSWMEPDTKACPSTIKPFDKPDLDPEHEKIRNHVTHCILPLDHDGDHRQDEFHTWKHEETLP